MQPDDLTTVSFVARRADLVAAPLGDELMMMDIAQGAYFGLNDVGAAIWERLAHPVRVSDLCASLQAEFEVAPAQCEADVLAFLAQLRTAGMLQVEAK